MIMMQNTTTATPVRLIPAEVEEEKTEEMRRIARKIFRAVDGSGWREWIFSLTKNRKSALY